MVERKSSSVGNVSNSIGVACIGIAVAAYCLTAIFWTIRAGVQPLSANSEFFGYSWIYAVRWGAGEDRVFQPHMQLIYPMFALINYAFDMTSGSALEIVEGWHRISLIWPASMLLISIGLVFSTIDKELPIIDALVSGALFMLSVPLFLSDQALNSIAYHSLAVPLALASLPLWNRCFSREPLSINFYVWLGIYTAACALGKPTFLAFATPLFAAAATQRPSFSSWARLAIAMLVAIATYFVWVFGMYSTSGGVRYHLEMSWLFMRSQASMYDAAKDTNPLNWYTSYVVGVMGWLPTALMVWSLTLSSISPRRVRLIAAVLVGSASGLFCLYQRSQLHAHPEFIGLLLAMSIATFRICVLPRVHLSATMQSWSPAVAVIASLCLIVLTAARPPVTSLNGFATFMNGYDAAATPLLFGQPKNIQTLALQLYPVVFWGTGDAWCRGSSDLLDGHHSRLLDKAVGNFTCMHGVIDPAIDLKTINRVVFPKEKLRSLEDSMQSMSSAFKPILDLVHDCREIDGGNPTFDIVECDLYPEMRR